MPISALGSEWGGGYAAPRRAPRGFTLIELLIVLAIVAVASGLATLAIRDADAARLDEEAVRLASLLDLARAESRTTGQAVQWTLSAASRSPEAADHFRFIGTRSPLPRRWLSPGTAAEVVGQPVLVLGPEPILAAQRVALRRGERRVDVVTDGLGPFAVVAAGAPAPVGGRLR